MYDAATVLITDALIVTFLSLRKIQRIANSTVGMSLLYLTPIYSVEHFIIRSQFRLPILSCPTSLLSTGQSLLHNSTAAGKREQIDSL